MYIFIFIAHTIFARIIGKTNKRGENYMSNQIKPGTSADRDMNLYVKDASNHTIGQISVKKGQRIPPTNIKGASHYSLSD